MLIGFAFTKGYLYLNFMCPCFILFLQLLSKLNIAITEEESEELIRALDLDGDGEIDFEGKG